MKDRIMTLVGGNALTIQLLPGHVLITRDPIVDTTPSGLILLPPHYEELSSWAYVHLHEPGNYWEWWGGESPLTGRRVIIEKLSGRPFTLHGLDLWLLPEHSILAVETHVGPQGPVEEAQCSETS